MVLDLTDKPILYIQNVHSDHQKLSEMTIKRCTTVLIFTVSDRML